MLSAACAKAPTNEPAVPVARPLQSTTSSASAPAPSVVASGNPKAYQGLGAESVPKAVLAAHAPPALPPGEARHIQGMLDMRAPSMGMAAADGKRLFFTWSITGGAQLFRLDRPMGFPIQLTGGEQSTELHGLTKDGRFAVVQRDHNGEENPGIYLVPAEGGPLTLVQHLPKVQSVVDRLSLDGTKLYFHSNDEKADAYNIYAYTFATQSKTHVFSRPGLWMVADESQDGQKLLLKKEVGSNMNEYYIFSLQEKDRDLALQPAIGIGEREDYVAAFGHQDELLVLTPKIGEFRRLYKVRPAPGAEPNAEKPSLEAVSPELGADIEDFSVDAAKTRILLRVNQRGSSELLALDAKTKAKIAAPPLPKADQQRFGSTTANGKWTTLQIDPGTSPVRSFVYSWNQKALLAWHVPSTPEIDTSKFARAELTSYPAKDGTSIPAFVRVSTSCKKPPCPVIVSFHGGPEGQTLAGFSTRAQLFVDAGFTFFEPNVRGSDGYGKTWLHADDGPKREAVLSDIADAATHVRAKYASGGVAPKVGVYGGSYGGYSTLAAMTIFAGSYDAGVSVVGISSLITFLENTAPYRRILRMSEYGDPVKDREALKRLSPIEHIDKLKAPLMVLQGATDPRVPVGEAIQFYEAAKKNGVPAELQIYLDEGHGMRKRSNQVLALGHTLRFFRKHLMQEETK
jgi:protease II